MKIKDIEVGKRYILRKKKRQTECIIVTVEEKYQPPPRLPPFRFNVVKPVTLKQSLPRIIVRDMYGDMHSITPQQVEQLYEGA